MKRTVAGPLLAFNAGSSSLKFTLYSVQGRRLEEQALGLYEFAEDGASLRLADRGGRTWIERRWQQSPELELALRCLIEGVETHAGSPPIAAGHRVVHGGAAFTDPLRIDASALRRLEALTPLAPLHQPACLAPMRALRRLQPRLPQFACFDTAFHANVLPVERIFALPQTLTRAGIRRYGFHGLSYEFIAGALPGVDRAAARGRTIVAHLGNGASLCALRAGKSQATTMGFSALDGLMMGTRCGSLDPGVLLYLLEKKGYTPAMLEELLYRESGLLGVSGLSSDMRRLRSSRKPAAQAAIALFVHRIVREIGALAAVLGGLDALVFTAGIGEHDAALRAAVCADCAWLGLRLDARANQQGGPRLHTFGSRVHAWVLPTNENRVIARHCLRLLENDAR